MIRDLLWLANRLLRASLAELCALSAAWLPLALAHPLWRLALALERHCESATLDRALATFAADRDDAFAAFEAVLRQLYNPWNTSASDLHLARLPARLRRRLATRLTWGRAASGAIGNATVDTANDRLVQVTLLHLAIGHFERCLARDELEPAAIALDAWRSLTGWSEDTVLRRATAELAWRRGEHAAAFGVIRPLLVDGPCPSPFDVLDWGIRALEHSIGPVDGELLRACFEHAERWLPEARRTWRLGAALARIEGDRDAESRRLSRLLSRSPQDVAARLRWHALHESSVDGPGEESRSKRPSESLLDGTLSLEMPSRLEVGEAVDIHVRFEPSHGSPAGTIVYPLPPAGWGLEVEPRRLELGDDGIAHFELTARRGDRVRGRPWPLVVLAVSAHGHLFARATVAVDDPHPGESLLVVSEDHEIHEERGFLDTELLANVLVEKSRFAADSAAADGVPWTHFVEVGSTLAMFSQEVTSDEPWTRLRSEVCRHLAREAARGHDLQPHLHTFNDPAYGHFPYALATGGAGWRPSLHFLLTHPEDRGDWASVTPPPGPRYESGGRPSPTFDRLRSVERAVAQLESVARVGNPDHCAVLWRSGLLEYGATPDERAWSAVALRRAGLLAASDLAKPGSPDAAAVSPAFPAGWRRPFTRVEGGPILQLPIVANLEGDYRMGRRRLEARARATMAAVAGRPGIHCFTLITHDKFINARRGGDEFLFDRERGEWPLIRRHLEAWRQLGARPVTATEAVRALVDDWGWHPEALLVDESWCETEGSGGPTVRYRLDFLGPRPPASPEQPFPLHVHLPCSLRSAIVGATVRSGGDDGARALETELELRPAGGADALWVDLPSFDPLFVLELRLRPDTRIEDFRETLA